MARFNIESVFKAIDKVSAPVRKMQSRMGKFTRSIQRGFRTANRSINKFGASLKKIAVVGVASLLSLGFVMGDVIRTGAEFEQTLVSAAVKFPEGIRKGTKAFEELEKVARITGATTEFTATQAAEGLNFLAFAGFNAEQSIAALPGIVDLATAAQIDLGQASDIATDSLGAFGLATKDAAQLGKNLARVNDVMALTTIRANTDMETFFEAIKKGAPAFTAAGQSIESFSALVGVMANSGIKGSEAGTILRNTVLRLSDPVSKAAKIMKNLGVQVADSDGNFRDILDIMEDFEKGLKGMGEVQRAAALSTVFGTRAVSGLAVQLKEGTTSISAFREELRRAAGTTKEMAGVMRDTLQGRIFTLTSAIEGLKITLLDLKSTGLGGVIESMVAFVRSVDTAIKVNEALATELIDGLLRAVKGLLGVFAQLVTLFIVLKTATLGWGAVVATATVLTGAFNLAMAFTQGLLKADITGKGLSTAATLAYKVGVGGATAAQWLWNAALSANPIGLVIIAVATLIGLGVLLIKNWDNIVAAITSAVNKIKAVLGFLVSPIENIIGGLLSVFGAAKDLGLIGGGEGAQGAPGAAGEAGGPNIVTPQDRIAQTIDKRIEERSTVDVNIKGDTDQVEVSQKGTAPGVNLKVAESGGF